MTTVTKGKKMTNANMYSTETLAKALIRDKRTQINKGELTRLIKSNFVKDIMIYNETLEAMIGVSKKAVMSALESENLDEYLRFRSVELDIDGNLYIN